MTTQNQRTEVTISVERLREIFTDTLLKEATKPRSSSMYNIGVHEGLNQAAQMVDYAIDVLAQYGPTLDNN